MITLITKVGNELKEHKGVGVRELKALTSGESCWIDFCEPTKEEGELLASYFHFHPLAIEDCWDEVNHPKAEHYDKVLFIVFHAPRNTDKRFSTREVDFFLYGNQIVTFHKHALAPCIAVRDQLFKRPELFDRGADFLLYLFLDEIIDAYFPVLDLLEDRIDRLEDSIVINPSKDTVNGIFMLKREVLHLKKVIGPQREILNRFTRAEFPQVSQTSLLYFRDLYDHIFRIYDLAESFRDLLSGALEAYLSSLSNRMNEIMKVLTIITTVLLPMSLITGIYGMNFKHMPELDKIWGYPSVLAIMAVLAYSMTRYFRHKRWI